MTHFRLTATTLLGLYCMTGAHAQQPPASTTVPKLVRLSGSFQPSRSPNRPAIPSVESVTLSVYRDQNGGAALWQESQNVAVDANGDYSLVMGATQTEGMPMDLFASGEPRWLGTRINRPGEVEQPRVLMVSVPYALKASDAETLGGKPASAYLLAAPVNTGATLVSSTPASTAAPGNAANIMKPRASSGTVNFVGKFVNTTDLINSDIYDVNGFVGFGTTSPNHRLHVFNSSAIVDSNLSGQLYVQNTYPTNGQGHASLVLDKGSDSASAAISFNSVGVQVWDAGATDDINFHIRSLGATNPKPLTIEHGAAANSLYINASGNVGIGTQTPASKLDVAGDINVTGMVRVQGSPVLQSPGGSSGFNTAVGAGALQFNAGGVGNTASGARSLQNNSTGGSNTASGSFALNANTSGFNNTAIGVQAMVSNAIGSQNTAVGEQTLRNNTTGSNNIAIGVGAASSVSDGSNNIHIGNQGSLNDAGAIRLGDIQSSLFVAGVRGISTGNNDAIPVVIDSAGQLGTINSSRRFKEDIEDMGTASSGLMRLRPVTYRYKQPFADGSKPIQYGLIAEEVADVYPDLVAHSSDGQIETVKYQVLDSMLLNEVQRLETEIRELELQNRILQARLTKLESRQ